MKTHSSADACQGREQRKSRAMREDDWRDSDGQNVFEMLVANGGPGFWIRRTTWGGTLARIIRAGVFTKAAPYFGNPSVLMDVYGLGGGLKQGLAMVPVSGTYKTWRRIDAPPWAEQAGLRPLDDPAIDAALAALDRRPGKGGSKTSHTKSAQEGARIPLSVPYERKNEAKSIGARWSPTDKSWWLPAEDNSALSKARALGFLP